MIFVDTCVFVALADRRDQWHEKALKLRDKMTGEMLVSDLIISESVTIIGKRAGGKAAKKLYDFFTDNCEVMYADERLMRSGMQRFIKYDGKLSLADAVSIAVMELAGVKKILSFDSDFDKIKGIQRVK